MLRLAVLLLVLANAGYYAWTEGLLAGLGFAPAVQNEPQRMAQQVRPENMRLLTPDEVRQIESSQAFAASSRPPGSASVAGECLQAGLFNDEQAAALRTRLSALPAASWTLENALEPARWIIYMGRYANADAVVKKRAELRQRGVSFDALDNPALEPGLSLGSFGTEADAQAALARIATQGVRTARVIQERPEARGQRLRLPAVDAALKTQLEAIRPQLAGKPLQACR